MRTGYMRDDALLDLLVQRSVSGLSYAESDQLDKLAADHDDYDDLAIDEAATAFVVSRLPVEPMPASLEARLAQAANDVFGLVDEPAAEPLPEGVVAMTPRSEPAAAGAWPAWFAAAACLVIAAGVGWQWVTTSAELDTATAALETAESQLAAATAPTPGAVQRRADLLALPGTTQWNWTTTDHPSAANASGDVVWHSGRQEGYMRFEGLATNDPAVSQYQLWMFDPARDEATPVDGGVFDMPAGGGQVIVPIDAKLGVTGVGLFAVTVEPPGGVVVSSREQIALLAQP